MSIYLCILFDYYRKKKGYDESAKIMAKFKRREINILKQFANLTRKCIKTYQQLNESSEEIIKYRGDAINSCPEIFTAESKGGVDKRTT